MSAGAGQLLKGDAVASVIYPKFKQALWEQPANSSAAAGDVKAVLVDLADYTYSGSHEFLSDVPSGARVDTTANLASKTFTDGVFDAADTTFAAASGDPSEAVILFIDTGDAATSRLICYMDSGTGLPVTPNGADINVTWSSGSSKICAL